MLYQTVPPSWLYVDLRAGGALKALAHDRSFRAPAPVIVVDVPAQAEFDVPVAVSFAADLLQPFPEDLSAADRLLMMRNLRGKEVLDTSRYPAIAFEGVYTGSIQRGYLEGELSLRGKAHAVKLVCEIETAPDGLGVRGDWQGKLSDLGIRPFKALLGAIRLADWACLRLELRFDRAAEP